MGTPHKHRDAIIAWANGADIQFFDVDEWIDCHEDGPRWHEEKRYRIKPKVVKREGWVNVYPSMSYAAYIGYVFETQKEADRDEDAGRLACIRIEWEEEI